MPTLDRYHKPTTMHDLKHLPQCRCALQSSGKLRSVDRYLVTEVSVQPISPNLNGHGSAYQSQNAGNYLPNNAALHPRRVKMAINNHIQNS